MAVEVFLVPMVGDGTRADPFRGKYTDDAQVTSAGCIRYSREDDAICMMEAPQAYLDTVAGQADATRLATESNLDAALTLAQANAAKTIFEAAFIPGQFINEGDTRREAIRGVVGMFLFSQRLEGRFGEGWKAKAQARGINLNSTWQDFPQALKDEFIAIRDDEGWTNAELGVTNASTLREILQAVSSQYEQTPIFIGGLEV